MFQQQPRAHRADMLDEVDGYKRLARIHPVCITGCDF
jgi:hypothetical protein